MSRRARDVSVLQISTKLCEPLYLRCHNFYNTVHSSDGPGPGVGRIRGVNYMEETRLYGRTEFTKRETNELFPSIFVNLVNMGLACML